MAKNIVVYIFAFVLLLAIALGCVTIFKIGKGISDSFDTLFETDTQTDSGTNSDTGTSTESETVTDAITPHTVKLGDSGLQVATFDGFEDEIILGFLTVDLKPFTKYCVAWNIDENSYDSINEPEFSFGLNRAPDGRFYALVAPDLNGANSGGSFEYVFYDTYEDIYNNGVGYEFVSGESGDSFFVGIFNRDYYIGIDDIETYKFLVTQCVTDFTITEVLE